MAVKPAAPLQALMTALGYGFRDPKLLSRALTHRSHSQAHYERLEFLGDSVLGCAIARYLFEHYPDLSEGELSRLRAHLVREDTLVVHARQLDLGPLLLLGEGERRSGGHDRGSILADVLEAIFGAIMLDGGYAEAERVVLGLYVPFLERADLRTMGKDAKTLLQEYLQGRHLPLPAYSVIATLGQAHEQVFRVECRIPALKLTTQGEGGSRRSAEQQAAQAAYQQLVSTS